MQNLRVKYRLIPVNKSKQYMYYTFIPWTFWSELVNCSSDSINTILLGSVVESAKSANLSEYQSYMPIEDWCSTINDYSSSFSSKINIIQDVSKIVYLLHLWVTNQSNLITILNHLIFASKRLRSWSNVRIRIFSSHYLLTISYTFSWCLAMHKLRNELPQTNTNFSFLINQSISKSSPVSTLLSSFQHKYMKQSPTTLPKKLALEWHSVQKNIYEPYSCTKCR